MCFIVFFLSSCAALMESGIWGGVTGWVGRVTAVNHT